MMNEKQEEEEEKKKQEILKQLRTCKVKVTKWWPASSEGKSAYFHFNIPGNQTKCSSMKYKNNMKNQPSRKRKITEEKQQQTKKNKKNDDNQQKQQTVKLK